MVSLRFTIALGLLTVLGTGCNDSPRQTGVQGEVTLEGRPIERGQIEFHPIDGTSGPMVGSLIEHGRFRIVAPKGPMVGGTYQVRITGLEKTGEKVVSRVRLKNETADVYRNVVPAAYNHQSKLKAVISEADPNDIDFDIPNKAETSSNNR